MSDATIEFRRRLDDWLARPMFTLAMLFLAILAGITHRFPHPQVTATETLIFLWGLRILWPLFILEGIVRLVVRGPEMTFWQCFGRVVLVGLFPPLRMGLKSAARGGQIWLPWVGWRNPDKELNQQLERFFSVPMIVLALTVVPLLAIEFGWESAVKESAGLALFLHISLAFIWFAFAVEFIVRVSVAPSKLRYCVEHWLDLVIVLLPLLDFLPFLRVTRLGRLLRIEQMGRLGRVYRLRGLLTRAWRALLLLEVVARLTGRSKEKRLKRLEELLAAKEEEIAALRQEIAALRRQIEAEKAQAVALGSPPAPDGDGSGPDRPTSVSTQQ